MKKKFVIVCGGLVILLLIAGFIAPKIYLKILEKQIKDIDISEAVMDENTLKMKIKISVTEKSLPVFIDSLYYETILFNDVVSKGMQRLDPNERHPVKIIFPVTIANKVLKSNLKKNQGKRTDVIMKIKHYCDFPILGKKQVDVVKHIHMVLPVAPIVSIADLHLDKMGLDDIKMTVTIKIDNPNNMDYTINKLDFNVTVKEYAFSKGKISSSYRVKANDVTYITTKVHTDLKHAFKTLKDIIKGDTEWPYHLTSTASIKPSDSRISEVIVKSEKRGIVDVKEALKTADKKKRIGIDGKK